MKVFLVICITKKKKPCTKHSWLWIIKLHLQCNKIFHLEDTMHKMHNKTTWNEKLFASKLNQWYNCLSKDGIGHYVINSLLFLTNTREKFVKMY